jgi:hypothetical protein
MPTCALVYAARFSHRWLFELCEKVMQVLPRWGVILSKSTDYAIHFEKYTLPLSTVVFKLPNSDLTESIINFIMSKFTHV